MLENKDFDSIYAAIEQRMAKQGEYILMSTVIKSDPVNNLIWVSECGDQPIPLVGFDRRVRVYDSDTVTAQSVGAMQVIQDQLLGSSQASIDFSSIPSTYFHLQLQMQLRGDAAGTFDFVNMQFNGDTSANYDSSGFRTTGDATTSPDIIVAGTFFRTGFVRNSGAGAGKAGITTVEIPCYAETAFHKNYNSRSSTANAGINTVFTGMWGGGWRSANAINRITLTPNAGGNFIVGSHATLYGMGLQSMASPVASVVEKEAKITFVVPKVGDLAVIALERGTRRLPRCLGKVQSTNYILTSLDEA